jgi:hypothetical protein
MSVPEPLPSGIQTESPPVESPAGPLLRRAQRQILPLLAQGDYLWEIADDADLWLRRPIHGLSTKSPLLRSVLKSNFATKTSMAALLATPENENAPTCAKHFLRWRGGRAWSSWVLVA